MVFFLLCFSETDGKVTHMCLVFNDRIKHENVVGMEEFYESRTHYYLIMQL